MLLSDSLLLFAQMTRKVVVNNSPPPDAGAAAAGLGVAATLMCVIYLLMPLWGIFMLVVHILHLLSASSALNACSARNRTMEPGQVWMSFIPLAGIYFWILTIIRVPESLEREYRARGLRGDGDYGKSAGLYYLISNFLCCLVSPFMAIVATKKNKKYADELSSKSRRRDDDLDDDDDERPRKSRDRDDDRDDDDERPRKPRKRDDDDE